MAKKPNEKPFEEKYHVMVYYKAFDRECSSQTDLPTLELCHEWLNKNKTKKVSVIGLKWTNAKMVRYKITKITTTREVIEKKSV